jgi:hypothetical protein
MDMAFCKRKNALFIVNPVPPFWLAVVFGLFSQQTWLELGYISSAFASEETVEMTNSSKILIHAKLASGLMMIFSS